MWMAKLKPKSPENNPKKHTKTITYWKPNEC